MKRKIFSVLFALVLACSLGMVTAVPVSAAGHPTIDGVIGPGEWDGAVSIPVADGMGTVKLLASTDYLYVLFDLVDPNDARTQYELEVGNDQISLNINPTDGGSWGFPYDLIFETSALSAEDGGHHQLPWNPKVNSGIIDGWATRWFPNDAQEDLPDNLESATIYSGGKRITEWKLPLASIAPSLGYTLKVGGAIDVGDGSSYVYPIGLDWGDASTYVGYWYGVNNQDTGLYYQTIQAAIDAASLNDNITVPAGTYTENVVVDETLTLQGENRDTTEIKFGYDGYPSASPLTISADGVTVSGFTIRSGPYIEPAWTIMVEGNSALLTDLNVIKDALLDSSDKPRIGGAAVYLTPGLDGFNFTHSIVDSAWNGIYTREGSSDIVVRNVDFTYPGEYAIFLKMITGAIIEENTFTCTGHSMADKDSNGIVITRGSNAIEIRGRNQFIGSQPVLARNHIGILLQAYADGTMGSVGILSNEISGFNTGILVEDVATSGISIHYNNITGNTYGVESVGPKRVDATKNWWGSANGSEHAGNTFNVGFQGDKVSDDVDYVPWLNAPYDMGESFAPVENTDTGGQFSSIQAAIDDADTVGGHTIIVAAGIYAEEITIGTANLTLQSASKWGAIIRPTTTQTSYQEAAIRINADGVTIDGFEIDGTTVANNGICGWNTSGLTIKNNKIHGAVNAWDGIGILLMSWGDSGTVYDNLIEGNEVYDTGRMGIMVMDHDGSNYTVTSNNTITRNTVHDVWKVTWGDHGGGIQINVAKDCSITDNLIYDVRNSQRGIYMYGSAAGNTIKYNTIRNNPIGIHLWISGEGGGPIVWGGETATSPQVHYNNIYDNSEGAISTNLEGFTPIAMDATCNWWGTTTDAGVDAMVSGNVTYDPWHLKTITTLTANNPTVSSVDLSWTTTGAWDGDYFDVRYSTSPITTAKDWSSARRVTGEPTPSTTVNTSQGMRVHRLSGNTTYHFGLKLIDKDLIDKDIGSSDISNIVSATTNTTAPTDIKPPSAITDLEAATGTPPTKKVILSWTAKGDDGTAGIASKYIIKRSTSNITAANFDSATTVYNNLRCKPNDKSESFTVRRLTPNTTYYFAIKIQDEVPNTSDISNVDNITTANLLPTVSTISPPTADNGVARPLTITGLNFTSSGTTVVRLISDDNTFHLPNVTYDSATQLTAVVPIGAPTGTYKARVINNNGRSAPSSATYTVTATEIPLPVVTNLIPQMAASSTAVSGVKIFGKNFTGATAVRFGDTAATSFTVISDTKITANVTGLTAGEYDVKVTTPAPAGTNSISAVKFKVSAPVVINTDATEDTTTSEVIDLGDTNVTPVQITLTTDTSETATQATDTDAEIEVVIPPQTMVRDSKGAAYTGNIHPPRLVKPDESVLTGLPEDAVVIEMGNPEETINFLPDFVATVTVTASGEPDIWYFNKDTQAYELAGKTGTEDGIDYVPGGTKLNQEDSTYTMGLLLDHMSAYIVSVESLVPAPPAPPPAVGGGDGAPPTPEGTTDVSGKVSDEGVFTRSVTATSEDELCTLTIPRDTVGLTEELEPLDEITVVIMDEPPRPPKKAEIVGLAYDFGPDGATFEPAITLEYTYDPDDIPEWVDQEDLVIAMWDENVWNEDTGWGTWVELPCTVDTATHTITALVSHFTTFAVIARRPVAPPPAPAPAAFSVSSLSIQPAEVQPKEAVTVSVSVANTGGTEGSYSVVLMINGVKEAEKRVTVAAADSQLVSFSVSKEEAGSYSVVVNGLRASFTVVAPAPPPAPPPPAPPLVKPPFSWPLVGGIMAGVVILTLLVFFFVIRPRIKEY